MNGEDGAWGTGMLFMPTTESRSPSRITMDGRTGREQSSDRRVGGASEERPHPTTTTIKTKSGTGSETQQELLLRLVGNLKNLIDEEWTGKTGRKLEASGICIELEFVLRAGRNDET